MIHNNLVIFKFSKVKKNQIKNANNNNCLYTKKIQLLINEHMSAFEYKNK